MNFDSAHSDCKSHQRFRLRFQRRLTEYQLRHGSAAEGFGAIWEKTLEELPIDDEAQGELYRELISWARSDELFTSHASAHLIEAWRETFHEF
jgi:hypothetical protein